MDLRTEHHYPAGPDAVFGMLTDPAFLRAKLEARGDTDVEVVECAPTADGYRIVTRRKVAMDVPGFARKVLNPTNTVTQTDVWSAADGGVRSGTWRVEAAGVPVTMSGTMSLAATPDGCVEVIEGVVRSAVPLVGGRLEKLVGGTAGRNLQEEHDFARRWLAGSH